MLNDQKKSTFTYLETYY